LKIPVFSFNKAQNKTRHAFDGVPRWWHYSTKMPLAKRGHCMTLPSIGCSIIVFSSEHFLVTVQILIVKKLLIKLFTLTCRLKF
jgi:hypothetical protein